MGEVFTTEGVCPNCAGLIFVEVEDSGFYNTPETGPIYWFAGYAACDDCGWEGEYSDSN